jgi:tRNA threonylcarbamoyl adenosine modification protein YeaZ
MNLTLIIDTSSRCANIAFANDKNIIFDTSEDFDLLKSRDVSTVVENGLKVINKTPSDINSIAVNIGPGGLNAIRSGVSFANALAFSLNIPVCPFTSFELMGSEVLKKFKLPVLCTAKASDKNAYIGLFDKGDVKIMRFGSLNSMLEGIMRGIGEFVVTGPHRQEVVNLLPDIKVHDSGIDIGHAGLAKVFVSMPQHITSRKVNYPNLVFPINDQSKELYE